MKIRELKALIAQLPDDAEVVVDGCGGLVAANATTERVLATDRDNSTFLLHSANMSSLLHKLPAPVALLIYPAD